MFSFCWVMSPDRTLLLLGDVLLLLGEVFLLLGEVSRPNPSRPNPQSPSTIAISSSGKP